MSSQGSRVKQVRQALNLTQEQFGAIFDATKSYISLVEKDNCKLSVNQLVKLLLDYNVNINFILGGIGQPFIAQPFEQVEDELAQKVRVILKEEGLIK